MAGTDGLDRQLGRSEKALRRKMGGRRPLRSGTLARLLGRAGRDLPRGARREAQKILETRAQMENPRLAVRSDPAALSGSFRRLDRAVASWNPARRRRNMWLNALAGYAFNLLLFGALLAAFLHWKG